MCQTHLNVIGVGLIMYATENEDQYPPTLEDLIDENYLGQDSRKILRSPADNIDRSCSYFYFAPTSMNEVPPKILVACTYKDVYNGFRNVLQIDCTVTRLSNAEFQAELAKPYNARFAAALKKAEGP